MSETRITRLGMLMVPSKGIDVPTATSMGMAAPPAPSNARAMVVPHGPIVTPVCTNPCAHPFNWRALLACEHERGVYRQTKCRECGQSTGPCKSVVAFIREDAADA